MARRHGKRLRVTIDVTGLEQVVAWYSDRRSLYGRRLSLSEAMRDVLVRNYEEIKGQKVRP